jgi:hypothetical protein
MSCVVCSPLSGLDTRVHHLHNRVPLTYPENAPPDRRWVICVIRANASTTVRDAPSSRQRRRNDWCWRGSRLDICDWEYHVEYRDPRREETGLD